jgi:hypothetical protein
MGQGRAEVDVVPGSYERMPPPSGRPRFAWALVLLPVVVFGFLIYIAVSFL